MEAEFVALSSAVQEVVWLKHFLVYLGVYNNDVEPVTINCDSQAAIAYTKDPKYYGKTKHIDMKYNFVRDLIVQKKMNVKYIFTHQIIAYPLTKSIACAAYERHVKSLGLRKY